jgi:hypothetical protein
VTPESGRFGGRRLAVLDTTELRTIAKWCRGRGLRFVPLRTGAAGSVILFEQLEPTRPWQRMKLVLDDDGFRLCDERDELLASGSDLPAMLDALDGGVAEPASRPMGGAGAWSSLMV